MLNIKSSVTVWILFFLLVSLQQGCDCENNEVDDDDAGCQGGEMIDCNSYYSEDLPYHDFEVTEDDIAGCKTSGVDITILSISYNIYRTKMIGEVAYKSTNDSPHYVLSLDADKVHCIQKLDKDGNYSITHKWDGCPGKFKVYFYKQYPNDVCVGITQTPACILTITPLPYPSDDCMPAPE